MKSLKIIAIFALLCPPLTGLLIALGTGIFWYFHDGDVGPGSTPVLQQTLMMAAYAVPMSYLMGGAQALFTGVGGALWAAWKGSWPLAVPLALAFIAWGAFSVSISSLWLGNGMSIGEIILSENGAFLLGIHLLAGAVGWWLVRRLT